jgi:hypothetical protein
MVSISIPTTRMFRPDTDLSREVNHAVQAVEEARLGRERANGDYALEKLAETGKDWRTRVRLHTSQVKPGVEVTDSEAIVDVANDRHRNQERREDDAARSQTVKAR